MIPKIIHYCWLSGDPIPVPLQKYMKSWKTYLPEYEFWLWNFDRFDINSSVWVQEAFQAKKYAFAADYIRCYALYNYGGIYLDMDVEVLKPFDDLLDLPYFIGMEDSAAAIEAAIMGAQKGHPLFQKTMEYYTNRHFVKSDGNYDTRPLPQIMRQIIDENFQYTKILSMSDFARGSYRNICLFPQDYFSPKSYKTKKIHLTENTYTIHHFVAGWHGCKEQLYRCVESVLGIGLHIYCLYAIKDFLSKIFQELTRYGLFL